MPRLGLILANGYVKLKSPHHTFNLLAAKCITVKDFPFAPVAYDWSKMNSSTYNETYFKIRDQYKEQIVDYPVLLSIANMEDAVRDFTYKRNTAFTIGCPSGHRYTRMVFDFKRDELIIDQSMACVPDVGAPLSYPIKSNNDVLEKALDYTLVHMKRETGPTLV